MFFNHCWQLLLLFHWLSICTCIQSASLIHSIFLSPIILTFKRKYTYTKIVLILFLLVTKCFWNKSGNNWTLLLDPTVKHIIISLITFKSYIHIVLNQYFGNEFQTKNDFQYSLGYKLLKLLTLTDLRVLSHEKKVKTIDDLLCWV